MGTFPAEAQPWSKRDKKLAIVATVCLTTALFAGITIWSFNGTVTTTTHHSNDYSSWDEIHTWRASPGLQAVLTFITICLLFIATSLLISYKIEGLKTEK